jgi:regulator of sigma E protease
MNELFFVLLAVVGIGFLIFIHEAGHYICARLAGVRVLVFSLGFGPRLLGCRVGPTDYRLSAVPLGGYVRVAGEDPTDPIAPPDGLSSKSVPARALFFLGGVMMNLLFAFVAFPLVFRAGVEFPAPVLGEVARGGPAWQSGLREGDRVREVAGKAMYSFDNMRVEFALVGDREVPVVIERDGRVFEQTIRPEYDPAAGLYRIGVEPKVVPGWTVEVVEGSPAAAAGLRSGDELIALDGEPVTVERLRDLESRLRYGMGDPVSLVVASADGSRREVAFTPARVPLERPQIGVMHAFRRIAGLRPGLDAIERLGLRVGDHVLAVDGQPFGGTDFRAHAEGPPTLTMAVARDGARVALSATFTPAERAALDDHVGLAEDEIDVVVQPLAGSPAEGAGVRPGDAIAAIDGEPIGSWEEMRAIVQAAGEQPLRFTVRRPAGEVAIDVAPATSATDLGFRIPLVQLREVYRKESIGGAISAGVVSSLDMIKSLYVTLKKMFTGEVAPRNLGGIITISRATYRVAQQGWELFVYFLALLSINLAVINLLPIPVLDGGHLLFVLIEGIKGSPVNPKVLSYSQILGLVFIVALLLFVTYHDILRSI